jgi:hypothetical protein
MKQLSATHAHSPPVLTGLSGEQREGGIPGKASIWLAPPSSASKKHGVWRKWEAAAWKEVEAGKKAGRW